VAGAAGSVQGLEMNIRFAIVGGFFMTPIASDFHVGAVKLEFRIAIMVELFGLPAIGRMTPGAVRFRLAACTYIGSKAEPASMNIIMAALAFERKLDQLQRGGVNLILLMTGAAGDRRMTSFKGKFRP
jgi:hypothetical protein